MSVPKNEDHDKTKTKSAPCANNDAASRSYCATLTGVGRSAIAVIAVTGPHAADAINRCFTPVTAGPYRTGQIRYGNWHGDAPDSDAADNRSSGESVVLTRQSDDAFEIHCHGGIAAIERIIDDLRKTGIQAVDRLPQAGHGVGGEPSLLIREAEEALSRCLTARTAAVALDQVRGAMRDWAESWINRLDDSTIETMHHEVAAILARAGLGMRVAEPFRVVLCGPPNVGKSSLINAIVGYDRSITLDLPGTTRDVLHADTVIDGLPIRLSDTAGLRTSNEPIESEGIARARFAAEQADLIIWVTEPGQSEISEHVESIAGKRLNVLNKADLLTNPDSKSAAGLIRTVATTGDGVAELMTAIADALGDGFPDPGTPVPLNQRQTNSLARIAASDNTAEIGDGLRELVGGPG